MMWEIYIFHMRVILCRGWEWQNKPFPFMSGPKHSISQIFFNREIFVWCYLPTIRCTNDSRIRFSRHVLAGMDQWSHWEYFCKHLTSVTSLLWHPGPRSSLPSLVHISDTWWLGYTEASVTHDQHTTGPHRKMFSLPSLHTEGRRDALWYLNMGQVSVAISDILAYENFLTKECFLSSSLIKVASTCSV